MMDEAIHAVVKLAAATVSDQFDATLGDLLKNWRLPSGRTVAEAGENELLEVSKAFARLAAAKRREANFASRRIARGLYEITLDGKPIGEVYRDGRRLEGPQQQGADL
jgi:hypothetical protein